MNVTDDEYPSVTSTTTAEFDYTNEYTATRPSTPTASTTTVDKFGDHKYHYERRRDKYPDIDDPNDYRRRVPLPSPGNEEFAKYHDTP